MLVRIMSIIQISNVKHFTFKLKIKNIRETNYDKKEPEKLIKSLDPLASIYTVKIYKRINSDSFTICNKGLSPIIKPTYIIPLL